MLLTVSYFSDKNVLNKQDPKYFLCVIFLTVLIYFPFTYLPSTFVEVKYSAPSTVNKGLVFTKYFHDGFYQEDIVKSFTMKNDDKT